MIEKVREGVTVLGKKPLRLLVSAALMIAMCILTAFAWDGIPKRLLICAGMTVLSGFLVLLPRLPNRISVPLLAVYLCYVPTKVFQRMELPVHDMTRLVDGAALLGVTLVLCVYLLVFLFTQSSAAALGVGNGIFLVLFLVEYYIWVFRGDFLTPNDLRAMGTAMSVMGSYRYHLSPEALYSVLWFLFFIVLGSRVRVRMHKWVHVGASLAAALSIGGWYYIVMETPEPFGKTFPINYWDMARTREIDGTCLSFFLLAKDSKVERPAAYSVEELQRIAQEAEEGYLPSRKETGQKPDIIMIMSEAWSDLRVLGELGTTEAYMPFVDRLEENTIRGNLYVPILGGLTANTEFEALTGNSLSLLSPAVVPYQNQVQHDMPSLARVLENQGYETMAMHPSGENAWNRNQVYSHFGFDEFIHQGVWEVPYEHIRLFISDECNFKEIVHRYENRNPEAPFFLFDVTIQNHGGYYKEIPLDIDIVNVGKTDAGEMGDVCEVQTYLNLLKTSDDAFGELVAYFEKVEDPVIICLFGDHQPILGARYYDAAFEGNEMSEQERNLQKYIVPYVIWANYDVDWEAYGDMSANYLSAALTEAAGLSLPPFYQYLMELHEEYPVLTKRGCYDKDGNFIDMEEIWDSEWIYQYRMLQYDQLYVEEYQKGIFEEAGLMR
nr:sulfatase-like hydrolase/transferase [uncultured Acetatifactor sp.]